MSINTLLRKYLTSFDKIAELYAYADKFAADPLPSGRRLALRCQTMALIYQDRNTDLIS